MSDLRTIKGREDEVLQEIRDTGGLNIHWATYPQARACAVDRLTKLGKIKRLSSLSQFPFATYEITK